jgi:NTP pyrophosphatase (non-canonical NTP hydrolase)
LSERFAGISRQSCLDWAVTVSQFRNATSNQSEAAVSDQTNIDPSARLDPSTSVEVLKEEMRQFVAEQDWHQFHSPKNLSMSIAIEAAELMEHFQWLTQPQSHELDDDSIKMVGEELADVLCYTLAMANQLNLDITRTIRAKMEKNRLKYPAEKFRGRYGQKDLDRLEDQ